MTVKKIVECRKESYHQMYKWKEAFRLYNKWKMSSLLTIDLFSSKQHQQCLSVSNTFLIPSSSHPLLSGGRVEAWQAGYWRGCTGGTRPPQNHPLVWWLSLATLPSLPPQPGAPRPQAGEACRGLVWPGLCCLHFQVSCSCLSQSVAGVEVYLFFFIFCICACVCVAQYWQQSTSVAPLVHTQSTRVVNTSSLKID